MSDVFGRLDEKYGIARMKRREPVLRSILARVPSFREIDEVLVNREEYDVLLDGEELPHGHVMTIMGKPVVVRP